MEIYKNDYFTKFYRGHLFSCFYNFTKGNLVKRKIK